jgi:hypothetical protein
MIHGGWAARPIDYKGRGSSHARRGERSFHRPDEGLTPRRDGTPSLAGLIIAARRDSRSSARFQGEGSMQFDECHEGEYRIFVGAMDAPRGDGYIAAVVVSRRDVASEPAAGWREVWRDDSLACGYRWLTPDAAIQYAKNRAREMVRKASPMLA